MSKKKKEEKEEEKNPLGSLQPENTGNGDERDEEFVNEKSSDDNVIRVTGLYKNYFLDYASYVILERAVPAIEDGLKPVQRRILHSMWEMEDGRYNKVANVIGNTMKYHPHGDASIGDAMVQIGQKNLLIDMQGNWGNIYTGDSAAAPRYIEARLSKFALDVVYSPKVTQWQLSYDGRNKEPVTLPVKFPLLLAQGVEGIAVGLACKILPHNFNELIEASIANLKGVKRKIVPDFPTGGMADFSDYNDGLRGGRIKVRARITQSDKKTLVITEIPFGTTTSTLIDSILKAVEKGKIKIKKVEDDTAEKVEIVIHLAPDVSPDKTIDALYAFTDCEVSISPNACVIVDDKPVFLGISEMMQISTEKTLNLLKQELLIKKGELEEQWHFASLEKIFIEKRIYRNIEDCETWEEIIRTIHKGLKPYVKKLIREVTDEDVAKLTEIKIKRISKFDGKQADEYILRLEGDIAKVKHSLKNLVDYAIDYFKELKKKYGEGKERKTEIKTFENIEAAKVAVNNVKLYVDRAEGFAGYNLRKSEAEFVSDCSDLDDIIVIRRDATMIVTKISEKAFVGKDIAHIGIFQKDDTRTIYNLIYHDGPRGNTMMKRFAVTSVIRDKEYHLGKGTPESTVYYLTANPNGESEVVTVLLRQKPGLKKSKFDFDFGTLAIKGRNAIGNILTKHSVLRVIQKEKGISTLSAMKIWFDDSVHRLNSEERGTYLGEFSGEDKILTITQDGHYKLTGFDLATHFEENLVNIEKWNPQKPVSCVYYDGEKKQFFIKRFLVEETDKKVKFISEHPDSIMEMVSTDWKPMIEVHFRKERDKERKSEKINVAEFISVKGLKAQGNRLSQYTVNNVDLLPPLEPTAGEIAAIAEKLDVAEIELEDDNGIKEEETKAKDKKNPGESKTAELPVEKKRGAGDKQNQIKIEF